LARKVGGGVVELFVGGMGPTAQSSKSVVNGPWMALGSSSFSLF